MTRKKKETYDPELASRNYKFRSLIVGRKTSKLRYLWPENEFYVKFRYSNIPVNPHEFEAGGIISDASNGLDISYDLYQYLDGDQPVYFVQHPHLPGLGEVKYPRPPEDAFSSVHMAVTECLVSETAQEFCVIDLSLEGKPCRLKIHRNDFYFVSLDAPFLVGCKMNCNLRLHYVEGQLVKVVVHGVWKIGQPMPFGASFEPFSYKFQKNSEDNLFASLEGGGPERMKRYMMKGMVPPRGIGKSAEPGVSKDLSTSQTKCWKRIPNKTGTDLDSASYDYRSVFLERLLLKLNYDDGYYVLFKKKQIDVSEWIYLEKGPLDQDTYVIVDLCQGIDDDCVRYFTSNVYFPESSAGNIWNLPHAYLIIRVSIMDCELKIRNIPGGNVHTVKVQFADLDAPLDIDIRESSLKCDCGRGVNSLLGRALYCRVFEFIVEGERCAVEVMSVWRAETNINEAFNSEYFSAEYHKNTEEKFLKKISLLGLVELKKLHRLPQYQEKSSHLPPLVPDTWQKTRDGKIVDFSSNGIHVIMSDDNAVVFVTIVVFHGMPIPACVQLASVFKRGDNLKVSCIDGKFSAKYGDNEKLPVNFWQFRQLVNKFCAERKMYRDREKLLESGRVFFARKSKTTTASSKPKKMGHSDLFDEASEPECEAARRPCVGKAKNDASLLGLEFMERYDFKNHGLPRPKRFNRLNGY